MKCKNCSEGWNLQPIIVTVSIDMAIDAGDRSLAGQSWDWGSEWIVCKCCGGEFENCEECSRTEGETREDS